MKGGLESVTLTFGDTLYEPGERITHVYFPGDSLVSLLSVVAPGKAAEVGLVGREGMVGFPIALGSAESSLLAVVQGTGTALRMKSAFFRKQFGGNPTLQREIFRFTHLLMTQIAQTAACNRYHVVDARLARWLLMTRDRLNSSQFVLTHEFLAKMLGVRREGVTQSAGELQLRKLIGYSRGKISILDQKGLEARACNCYGLIKGLYAHA